MKLAFYTPRRNFLKHFGPIIAVAKRRGWQTIVACPLGALATGKDDAHRNRELIFQESGADLRQVAWDYWLPARHGIDWVVSVGLRLPPWLERIRLASPQIRWASLDHIQESLLQVLEEGPAILDGWDLAATGSEEGIDALCHEIEAREPPLAWSRARGEETKRIREVFRAVGYPHLDPLASMDRATCRAKWNLPAGRIVLLAPAARPALLDAFHWKCYANPWAWAGKKAWHLRTGQRLMPYRDILRAFRQWADRHGAFVVAKVRDKTPCVRYLRGIADRMIGDEAFHPFTTLELCRAADAYVGLASAMAIEATAAGLPQVHVLAYPSEAYEVPAYLPFRRRFYSDLPGLWQNLGVRLFRSYQPLDRGYLTFWADQGYWPVIAPSADPDPLWRLAGPPDGRASERFLDGLAKLS